jgi:hypothetical protein
MIFSHLLIYICISNNRILDEISKLNAYFLGVLT